jgi:uncharacterized membrane protein (UPF0127 family)
MLSNADTGETLAKRVVLCNTFWRKFKGLMFRRTLDAQEAFVFVYPRESVTETTIHMLFVFFPIAVLWLDGEKRVVDKVIAKPFRPVYAPKKAAQYFVEGVPELAGRVEIGDRIAFPGGE